MKNEYGIIVKSTAGHDINKHYIIINSDERFVYVVDGEARTLEKPKKKNRKHIQFTGEKVFNQEDDNGIHMWVTNEFIKKKIKEYNNKLKKEV